MVQVVRLAAHAGATLVAVHLQLVTDRSVPQDIMMASLRQDVFRPMHDAARASQVQGEYYVFSTLDVLASLSVLIGDLHCDSVVVVTRVEGDPELLAPDEVACLLEKGQPASLVLVRLPPLPRGQSQEQPAGLRRGSWFQRWLKALQALKTQQARQASWRTPPVYQPVYQRGDPPVYPPVPPEKGGVQTMTHETTH